MKFTKLKLIGFKSFVDNTSLDIKPGLTGLVGPNGCGKSNIVEAIKWNMGEAGPSKLRANEMDDVIFNGTAGRPSRNSAEVILNIELEEEDTSRKYTDNDEVEISRKISKNEGSKYSINTKEVRQRDVQIFFADYAMGSRSNAIVDQGQIGNIINAKPVDRRQIIEEASGITGIRARKHETELKLNSTENNLEKLDDIISSDKLRLKDLTRQSNQAKKYKTLSEKIRHMENKILFLQWNDAKKNIVNIEQLLNKYSDQADLITAKISNLSIKIKDSDDEINKLRNEYQIKIASLSKHQVEYDVLENEKETSNLEINNIKENIEYLNNELEKEKNNKKQLIQQKTEIENDIDINRKQSNNEKEINYDEEIKNISLIQKNLKEQEINITKNIEENKNISKKNKNIIDEKNLALNNIGKEIEKHNASKTIFTKFFESNEKNTIINKISYSNGYDKAIEAALGFGLKASISKSDIQWKKINQKILKPLPANLKDLDHLTKGVSEISNILKSTGIVKSKSEGDKLQELLLPGQQLVSIEGDLWRWDGYTHSSEAETPVNQLLQNKKNLEKINNLLIELQEKYNVVQNDLKHFIKNNIELEKKNEKFADKLSQLRTEHDQHQKSYSYNIEKSSENKTQLSLLNNSQKEYNRIESQINFIDERIVSLSSNINNLINKLNNLKSMPNSLKINQIEITKKIENTKQFIANLSDNISLKESTYKELQNSNKIINNDLINARENKARQEGIYQEAKNKVNNLEKNIHDKLKIIPEKFESIIDVPLDNLPDLEECNNLLEKFSMQRERIGPVNLIAEQDSEELSKKISEIEIEKEDLLKAIQKLRESISNINKEARGRLLNAFDEVNKHFKILFTDLFGGGEAYLKLEGSDDPLESGLELFASPPGKKLQNMSLLSGGEQALTSMALIFSIFLTKPAPICILDEVDAPLDESNVERFLDLIKAIANKTGTRFIVVTHHRLSMSRMDRLYGVTMQEPGVSQLVSVSLKEAEKYTIN